MLYPIYVGGITLLQPWPAEESRLRVLIRPFDGMVNNYSIFRFSQSTFQNVKNTKNESFTFSMIKY